MKRNVMGVTVVSCKCMADDPDADRFEVLAAEPLEIATSESGGTLAALSVMVKKTYCPRCHRWVCTEAVEE